jgi:hypothetical protein
VRSKRRDPEFPEFTKRFGCTGRKPVVDGALDDGIDIAVLDRNDAAEPPRIPRDVPRDPLLAGRGMWLEEGGDSKNAGREWGPKGSPEEVCLHD